MECHAHEVIPMGKDAKNAKYFIHEFHELTRIFSLYFCEINKSTIRENQCQPVGRSACRRDNPWTNEDNSDSSFLRLGVMNYSG